MEFNLFIKSKIQKLIDEQLINHKKKIIFFKGFNSQFYKFLDELKINKFFESRLLNDREYIDVEKLEQSGKELVTSLLVNDLDVSWGYFEELLALGKKINDIHSMFDGQIIVVNNNLFEGEFPLELDQTKSQQLENYFYKDNDPENSAIEILSNYYCSANRISDDLCLFSYIKQQSEINVIEIDFFDESSIEMCDSVRTDLTVHVNNKSFLLLKNDLLNGKIHSGVSIVFEDQKDIKKVNILTTIYKEIGNPISIIRHNKFSSVSNGNADKHLNLLKKYWGADAVFRNLKVYKNPDDSNEIIEISQGEIVSEIINQASLAMNLKSYGDIFITAPTGAGKSLLFQIPAMFLAESNYNAVTIVITPLIALMRDQVENLEKLRGIGYATFINSEISFDEKELRLKGIKNGDYSILYLSPELLMANAIDQIIGERKIGLLIVDEAHLVTTWGRDFRADYWYLGDYIEKLRKSAKRQFPVVALTATAVYMGTEDMVEDTQRSLNLKNCILYLGSVRRDNIAFQINSVRPEILKSYSSYDEFKNTQTVKRVNEFVNNNKKTVCYFPYASQAQDVYNLLSIEGNSLGNRVGKYYGKLDKISKIESQEKFKNGEYMSLLCTKAFGMGVDVSDIDIVYHYAPTGNLTDYVQEIGRAARKKDIYGLAVTDFSEKDLKYVRMLYGLSGMKQYQLKEMLAKLYRVYSEKKSRNFLVSPDAFSYLFKDSDLDNKVKSGLLLIAKDLEQSTTFPVLIVRPKSMFTKNFVNVPPEIESEFKTLYGDFIRLVPSGGKRIEPSANRFGGEITITNTGDIYEIDMARFWEDKFSDLTFPQFKRQFFENELIKFSTPGVVSARAKIIIKFNDSFDEISEKLKRYIDELSKIFNQYSARREMFSKNDFRQKFFERLPELNRTREMPNILLDIFVAEVKDNTFFNQNIDRFKFIQARKGSSDEQNYRVMNSNHNSLKSNLSRTLAGCSYVNEDLEYTTFIPVHTDTKPQILFLAIILELFGLASYQIIGGLNTEIFIRVNDPIRLKRLAESNYSNALLTDIDRKRNRSQKVLMNFMTKTLTDQERWNLIEEYFLGKDEIVSTVLDI